MFYSHEGTGGDSAKRSGLPPLLSNNKMQSSRRVSTALLQYGEIDYSKADALGCSIS